MNEDSPIAGPGGAEFLGVISDTHGLVRPEVREALAGAELLLHAGDVGSPGVLDELEQIAPLMCVRGNVDSGAWAGSIPERRRVEWRGWTILILHQRDDLRYRAPDDDVDVVVFGHSHRPEIERRKARLYLNPGSAGPRRFKLPVSVARLEVRDGQLEAQIIELLRAD